MITLIYPKPNATVPLLSSEQKSFLYSPPSNLLAKDEWAELHQEDLSFPSPVEFCFEPRVDGTVTLTDSRGNTKEYTAKSGKATVYNLFVGESYTWYVKFGLMRSQSQRFYTESDVPRLLLVDSISNVRDLGGYDSSLGGRVRQGMVLRSTEMNSCYSISEAGKETLINELGIRTDIDLRGYNGEPVAPALDTPIVTWKNFPLAAYTEIFTPQQKELYRQSFELLANKETFPVIVHCQAGADRTGTWLYVLGALLGIDEGDLMTDYETSSFSVWEQRSRASETFREFLEAFHSYGKSARTAAENFLADCGVSELSIQGIRDVLISK